MHNTIKPVKYVLGMPCSFWKEGCYKIFVVLCGRKFRYKVRCTKCNACFQKEAYMMNTVSTSWHKFKVCEHK